MHKVEEGERMLYLPELLQGKALEAYSNMSVEGSMDYLKVKEALWRKSEIIAE